MMNDAKQEKLLKSVEKWDNEEKQDSQFVILCRETYNHHGFLTNIQIKGLQNIAKAFKIEQSK